MTNLIEGIQSQCNRVRELMPSYEEIGDKGRFGLAVLQAAIKEGEESLASGELTRMVVAFQRLRVINKLAGRPQVGKGVSMAYENTAVPVAKSQEGIRRIILGNGGTAVAFISQPRLEGFEAQVTIDAKTYRIRITAECKPVTPKPRRRHYYRGSEREPKDPQEAQTRRIWRVLFYHLKGVYEAARTGVMEFRELMLPFIVTKDNRTIAQHLLPKLDAAVAGNPARLLMAGNLEVE